MCFSVNQIDDLQSSNKKVVMDFLSLVDLLTCSTVFHKKISFRFSINYWIPTVYRCSVVARIGMLNRCTYVAQTFLN